MKTLISASILSADFACLGDDIQRAVSHGCNMIHFDVMDGHFVPNISYGVPVLKSVKKCTDKPYDVHLMISKPLDYIEKFASAGADIITFHFESESDTVATIKKIRECGCRVGISLKPATPAEAIYSYLNDIDMVLVMTVEPGFGGQSFMADMLDKISAIRTKANEIGKELDIEVDGGIDNRTAPLVKNAGANVLVSGSYIFKAQDIDSAIASLLA